MSLGGICGKSGQTNLIFKNDAACWCGFVYASKYLVFPPLAAKIAARRRGILATRRCRRSTGISAPFSSRAWRSSPRFWGGLSILVHKSPNSSQICYMGLQSGDPADCSILVMLPY